MRIHYAGDFSESWTTESHVARELEALGHTVHSDGMIDPETDLLLIQGNGGSGSKHFGAAFFRELEAHGIRTASYHLDLYVDLARQARICNEALWQTQHVFTADGDPKSQVLFESLGINHHWLPPACVSDECVPGIPRAGYDFDVVFVGAANYHPEHPWRRTLITALQKRYGKRFKLFDHHPAIRGLELNDLYASVPVVVGDSLCPPGHTRYFSDRIMETLGRGGFLIFPDVPGLDELGFVDGNHLRYYQYGDIDGIYKLVDYYLAHPDKAREIAGRGQAFVRDRHTYKDRVTQMLAEVGVTAHV